jgi:hypothetical protein
MKFLVVLFFVLFVDLVMAQQTVDKIKVNNLNLPSESASSALLINGSKQVKASASVSSTELEYLDGVSSAIQTQLNGKQATLTFTPEDVANKGASTSLGVSNTLYPTQNAVKVYVDTLDGQNFKLTGSQSASGTKTFTGRILATSTTSAFLPCPSMTQTQRDALSPVAGDCVFNNTSAQVEFYSGSTWASAVVSVNYVTAPGITNPKTCYGGFGGTSSTLASQTICAASPCVEVFDSCGSMPAPVRSGTGFYTIAAPAGTYANNAFVHCDFHCGAPGGFRNCNNATAGAGFMSAASDGSLSIRVDSTNQSGTANDSYVSYECTGQAP